MPRRASLPQAPADSLPTPLRQIRQLSESLPAWLQDLLTQAQASPMGTLVEAEPYVRALGKPVSEMLGTTFTPNAAGTGLPRRLRLTNWDARSGNLQLHGLPAGERFEATPDQLSRLIGTHALDLEQPPPGQVALIQRKLARLLGPK